VEEWHGVQVQKIHLSVNHLMRGQIHNIQGKIFSPWAEPVQLIESSHLKKPKSVVPQALPGRSFFPARHSKEIPVIASLPALLEAAA